MVPIIQHGEQIVGLQWTAIYAGDIAKSYTAYEFYIKVADERFGERTPWWEKIVLPLIIGPYTIKKVVDAIRQAQNATLNRTFDSYDAADHYGVTLWWGAQGDQVNVQIANTQERQIDTIWNTLIEAFETHFPDRIITVLGAQENGPVSKERVDEGRKTSSWYDFVNWLRNIFGEPLYMKAIIILGGVAVTVYALSQIANKLPTRK